MTLGRMVPGVICVLAIGLLAPDPRPSLAQSPGTVNLRHEYNVKAAFLYSFGRYVEWPAASFPERDSPFVISVLGEAPFGEALDRIAKSKKIQQRPIVVRRWKSLEECEASHILFVAKTLTAEEQAAVIQKLGTQPVLLVGETSGFAGHGGTLNFYLDQDTVRFEINVDSARRQRLTIDAKLLKLATVVKGP